MDFGGALGVRGLRFTRQLTSVGAMFWLLGLRGLRDTFRCGVTGEASAAKRFFDLLLAAMGVSPGVINIVADAFPVRALERTGVNGGL